MITIYLCATECRNATATPLYFYTDAQKYGPPNAYKFSPGLKQQFPKSVCRLNLKQYSPQELIHYMDNYYPIVLAIESIFPENYKGRCKKSIQFTYGVFSMDQERNVYNFKPVKQKMLVSTLCLFRLTTQFSFSTIAIYSSSTTFSVKTIQQRTFLMSHKRSA